MVVAGAHRMSGRSDRYVLGLVVSLVMMARFGQAFLSSGQVWPAGGVTAASLIMVIRYLLAAFRAR